MSGLVSLGGVMLILMSEEAPMHSTEMGMVK